MPFWSPNASWLQLERRSGKKSSPLIMAQVPETSIIAIRLIRARYEFFTCDRLYILRIYGMWYNFYGMCCNFYGMCCNFHPRSRGPIPAPAAAAAEYSAETSPAAIK